MMVAWTKYRAAARGFLVAVAVAVAGASGADAQQVPVQVLRQKLGVPVNAQIQIIHHAGTVESVAPYATVATLQQHDRVFAKIGAAPARETRLALPARVRAFTLPYRWLATDAAGIQRVLRPVVLVDGGGLAYDVATNVYRGALQVGLINDENPTEGTVPLSPPVQLMLTLSQPGSLDRNQLAIDHTSLAFAEVGLRAPQALSVRVRTAADLAGVEVPVPVVTPSLTLSATPSRIQGFGLARSALTVSPPVGFSDRDTVAVAFSSKDLAIHPAQMLVRLKGENQVWIRSGMPGRHTILALVAGAEAGRTELEFSWPWEFLSAWIVGDLVGAALMMWRATRKRTPGLYLGNVLKGLPYGLIVAALGALGVDVLKLNIADPGAWIAVMVVAALGAWGGPKLLSTILPQPSRA